MRALERWVLAGMVAGAMAFAAGCSRADAQAGEGERFGLTDGGTVLPGTGGAGDAGTVVPGERPDLSGPDQVLPVPGSPGTGGSGTGGSGSPPGSTTPPGGSTTPPGSSGPR
jgi:hypothetical protein